MADELTAVIGENEALTADLGEAQILVMQGMKGDDGLAPRVGTSGKWEVFDNSTQAWVDTGVYAHGQDAYSPYIGDNGYWYVWDDQGQEYVNTNVKAQGPQGDPGEDGTDGEDGVSPEVTVESIPGGHQVTITDKEHPSGQSFAVMNGSGISEDVKAALLACFENVAWISDDGQDYYDALETALYPPKTLVSISAVFTQGQSVIYESDSLDTLKQYLVVTAHYDDLSTETITNYTLSGTLTAGTSTITVTYSGKTDTFDVTVSQAVVLSSISAVFAQGSNTVYDTDSLDTLKQYLVVTATMTDSTTQTLEDTDYTLSGTLTVGTSTITVLYGGKTATFSVVVSELNDSGMDNWYDGRPYRNLDVFQNSYVVTASGAFANYSGWDRTGYVPCDGAAEIVFPALPQSQPYDGLATSNYFYTANKTAISSFSIPVANGITVTVPQNAAYWVCSSNRAALATFLNGDITPYASASE